MSGTGRHSKLKHSSAYRKMYRENIHSALTENSIKRLGRRGGVKRMKASVFPVVKVAMWEFLHKIIAEAVTFTEHSRRKTVTAMDVTYALKRNGRTIYGFGA